MGDQAGVPDFWGSIGRMQRLVMSVRLKNGAAEVWARVLVNRRPTSGKSWGIVDTTSSTNRASFHSPLGYLLVWRHSHTFLG